MFDVLSGSEVIGADQEHDHVGRCGDDIVEPCESIVSRVATDSEIEGVDIRKPLGPSALLRKAVAEEDDGFTGVSVIDCWVIRELIAQGVPPRGVSGASGMRWSGILHCAYSAGLTRQPPMRPPDAGLRENEGRARGGTLRGGKPRGIHACA